MLNTSQIKTKHLFFVFLGCLSFCMITFFSSQTLSANSDDIGPFFSAVKLAGLDWPSLSMSPYYGQAYYIFFAPLFFITDNLLLRHLLIQVVNLTCVSGIGVIIYYIAVKFFRADNSPITALIPIIIIQITPFLTRTKHTWNEPPGFIVIWIVCLILVCLCNTDTSQKRKQTILTLLLAAFLFYGMLIHTRLVGLVIAIVLAVIIYYFLFKKWILNPLVFLPVITSAYLGSEWIKRTLVQEFAPGRVIQDVKNVNLIQTGSMSRSFDIRSAVDIILNNLYAYTVETFGFVVVAVAATGFFTYRILLSIRKHRLKQFETDTGLLNSQLFIFLVFGICFIGTIVGIYPGWGGSVSRAMSGTLDVNIDGLQYARYYGAYFGPMFLVIFSYLLKRKRDGALLCLTAIGIFALLTLYVWFAIYPYAGDRVYVSWFFIQRQDFVTTFVAISVLLLILALCLHMNIGKHFFVLLFSLILVLWLNTISPPFFTFDVPLPDQGVYHALVGIKDETPLPYDIYSRVNHGRFQYYFSHNRVLNAVPDENTDYDCIFICSSGQIDEYIYLFDDGYILYIAGERAMWIRGDELSDALYNYALSTGTESNIIQTVLQLSEEST